MPIGSQSVVAGDLIGNLRNTQTRTASAYTVSIVTCSGCTCGGVSQKHKSGPTRGDDATYPRPGTQRSGSHSSRPGNLRRGQGTDRRGNVAKPPPGHGLYGTRCDLAASGSTHGGWTRSCSRILRRMVRSSITAILVHAQTVTVASSEDLAYLVGESALVLSGPQGERQVPGKYLGVWRKIDGEWQLAALSWTGNTASSEG
jgi:hypothetical protein